MSSRSTDLPPWGVGTDLPVPGDYDGDGKTDLAVFRPATAHWLILKSSTNYDYNAAMTYQWGANSDIPIPGDYDGDHKTDIAVYRPSTGVHWILKSTSNFTAFSTITWGAPADVPLPGDYDGDGKTDPAVFRPATGYWHILKSSANYDYNLAMAYQWGGSSDLPIPGDYDADHKTDIAFYRPSTGAHSILTSTSNFNVNSPFTVPWGLGTDVPAPGDYDGDGRTDIAVYRPSTGQWLFLASASAYASQTISWGQGGQVPIVIPGDYDGDGRTDLAVYELSNGGWRVLRSSGPSLYNGEARVTGGGSSIQFATVNALANGSVSADWHVAASSPWTGVVARYSDTDNYLLAWYSDGALWINRRKAGAWTTLGSQPLSNAAGVHRLRVELAGTTIRVLWDGVVTLSVTDSEPLPGTRAGLAWYSGYDTVSKADNFLVESNVSPVVTLTTPANGATYPVQVPGTATIPLTATASDVDGGVARVEFFSGSTLIGTLPSPPYAMVYPNVGPGTYLLRARAYDSSGAFTDSTPVSVTVTNVPPVVTLTLPASGATFPVQASGTATISLAATASDVDGGVARVEFFSGSTLIGWVLSPPYTMQYPNVGPGTYQLRARAYDSSGAFTDSTAATVRVNAPPQVTLTTPANGATIPAQVSGTATITLAATASDPDDGVARVEFFSGSTLIGTLPSLPYTMVYPNVGPGTYQLRARAYDAFGVFVDSTTATVNVVSCEFAISPASSAATAAGASVPVGISTAAACPWSAVSHAPWIQVISGAYGTGAGSATVAIDANPGTTARSGTATIAGRTFTVSQDASSTPETVSVRDTFTDVNETPITSHVPDVNLPGQSWNVVGAAIVARNQQLLPAGYESFNNNTTAMIETNMADGTIAVDWTPAPASATNSGYPLGGLVIRGVDHNNYLAIGYGITGGNGVALARLAGGVWTTVTTVPVPPLAGQTHRLEVRLDGPEIEVWSDGVLYITAIETAFQAATKHGFRWWPGYDWTSTFDNYVVQGPQPCSYTLSPAATTVTAAGGSGTFTATAPGAGCSWSPSSPVSWIAVTGSNQATGEVSYTVAPNTSPSERYGFIRTGNSSFSVTQHIAPPSAPETVYVYDTFAGDTGTPITSHQPDINNSGGSWTAFGPAPMLHMGQLKQGEQNASLSSLALFETGASDATIKMDWTPGDHALPLGVLALRALDDNNYLAVGYGLWGDGRLSLAKYDDGEWTLIASADPGPMVGTRRHLDVKLVGTNIQVWSDGVLMFSVLEGMFHDGTKHGFRFWPAYDWASGFDNFTVLAPTPLGDAGPPGGGEPEAVRLVQAPTVIASIAPDGTPNFVQAPEVAVSAGVDGLRFAVPKLVLSGTRLGFLDFTTGIHWRTAPDARKAGGCFGNCGAGCTAKMIGGLLPSPCESPDFWELELLTAHTSPSLIDVEETRAECIGPDAFLNEYDVYMGTVRWTYHGVWTQGCEDHDWVMRENGIDGSIGLLPFLPSLCVGGGPRNWSFETPALGLKLRTFTLLPEGTLACQQTP